MNDRMWRAALGLAYAITFILVGLGIFAEPGVGVIMHIALWGISPYFVAWAFIVSGVINGIMGIKGLILNPAAFSVFILYTGFAWVAAQKDPNIPIAPPAFYTLLCVVYFLTQWAERSEDSINHGRSY